MFFPLPHVPLSTEQLHDFVLGRLDMDGELYERLYTYYTTEAATRMPYGTAKARDGDPDQWMDQQLWADITAATGLDTHELLKSAEVMSAEDFVYLLLHEAAHRNAISRIPRVLGFNELSNADMRIIDLVLGRPS